MTPSSRTRTTRALTIAAALLIPLSMIGFASPANAATITACVNNSTGVVRIPTNGQCGGAEHAVSWDQDGVQAADLNRVSNSAPMPANTITTVSVSCPAGQELTGGGHAYTGLAGSFDAFQSFPSGSLTTWQVTMRNSQAGTLFAFGICLDVNP